MRKANTCNGRREGRIRRSVLHARVHGCRGPELRFRHARRVAGGRDGAVLGVVMVVLVVISLVGVGLMAGSRADVEETASNVARRQAFWNADAGIEEMKAWTTRFREPFETMIGFSLSWTRSTGHGSYTVTVAPDPLNGGSAIKRYDVTSVGTSPNGEIRTIQVHVEIESFSSYMHASNYEQCQDGRDIYFATGDVIDGQIYSNDEFNIYGSPIFRQLARTLQSTVNYQGGADSSVFEGGLQFNAPPLDFSQFADHVDNISYKAQYGGQTFSGDYRLTFVSDGTMISEPDLGGGSYGPAVTNDLSSYNGAVYVDGQATLRGVLDGRVTVAAETRIVIDSTGIQYESAVSPGPWDPGFDPDNVNDALGMVCRTEVRLLGNNDLTVHGAVLVTQDGPGGSNDEWGFHAEQKYIGIGTPYINLYGSLSQYRRGVVGRLSSPRQGFLKNYGYDRQFLTEPPPHYPYSVYTISQWRES